MLTLLLCYYYITFWMQFFLCQFVSVVRSQKRTDLVACIYMFCIRSPVKWKYSKFNVFAGRQICLFSPSFSVSLSPAILLCFLFPSLSHSSSLVIYKVFSWLIISSSTIVSLGCKLWTVQFFQHPTPWPEWVNLEKKLPWVWELGSLRGNRLPARFF